MIRRLYNYLFGFHYEIRMVHYSQQYYTVEYKTRRLSTWKTILQFNDIAGEDWIPFLATANGEKWVREKFGEHGDLCKYLVRQQEKARKIREQREKLLQSWIPFQQKKLK